MTKWQKISFLLILILAFVLRFYKLGEIPAGFHADEAAFGYNAYSIYLTGRDEYGTFLPVFFRSLAFWYLALYAYLAVPSIALFGLTEFAVRLPSAIFGFLTIPLVFLLTRELTKKNSIAIVASFLLAILPAQVNLSRVQSDPLVAVFLILLGFYFFLLGKKRNSLTLFIVTFFVWLLSLFTHYLGRTFVPLFFILLIIAFWREISFKFKKILFFLFLIFILLPTLGTFLYAPGRERYSQLSIFRHPEVRLVLEEQIREDAGGNVFITRLFHNKLINYSKEFLKNYFSYFSFDFLFTDKENPMREVIPGIGIFYLTDLFLIVCGSYFLFEKKESWFIFLLGWILLAPVGPAFAFDETPNIHRFLIATPAFVIIMAYGILNLVAILKQKLFLRRLFILMLSLIFLYNLSFYLHQYYVHQLKHRPWYRHYGYKELVSYIDSVKKNYRQIYITKAHGSPYIFFLFYQKYDPKTYWAQGSPRDPDYGGFDKYIFIPHDCPLKMKDKGEPGVLYINRGECELPKTNVKLLKTILREDKTPAFQILEYVD